MAALTAARRRIVAELHLMKQCLWARPEEVGLGFVLMLYGIIALPRAAESVPESLRQGLPAYMFVVFAGAALVAGGATLLGRFTSGRTWWSPGVEQLGLYLAGGTWFSYAVAVIARSVSWRSGLFVTVLVVIGLACIIRARTIAKDQQATVDTLRDRREATE